MPRSINRLLRSIMEMHPMSNESWKDLFHKILHPTLPPDHPLKTAIVGIGNVLCRDDGVGELIATRLSARLVGCDTVQIIAAGIAPESCTGLLRRFEPDLVILIDSANFDALPGTVRWIVPEDIEGVSASTHTLPLSLLVSYLATSLQCYIGLLAIQPFDVSLGEGISLPVQIAADALIEELVEALHPDTPG
ncbi:MAG: hydrogenase 3 maturation endopeptidase HyCI [Chloroflexi bacterium]|nr:hydrogenase 3 maturation endopeptidase HyCI [Chloroflexota bacterium]